MRENLWFWVISGASIWTVGDIFIKQWVESDKLHLLVIGILIWIAGLLCLAESFKYKNMVIAGVLMVVVNAIMLAIVSWVFYKEQLTVLQIAGVIVGMVGLYLLEVG